MSGQKLLPLEVELAGWTPVPRAGIHPQIHPPQPGQA